MTDTPKPPGSTTNPRRIGIVALGLLVLAVAVAAVVTTLRPPQDLDPGTPEGVIQRFLQAVEARDFQAASALLGPELAEDCTAAELALDPSEYDRAVITDVAVSGSEAVVWVDVRRIDTSGPLNPYTYEEVMEFELDISGEAPVITWLPWQFYCGDEKP
jgi:hypothetical protein